MGWGLCGLWAVLCLSLEAGEGKNKEWAAPACCQPHSWLRLGSSRLRSQAGAWRGHGPETLVSESGAGIAGATRSFPWSRAAATRVRMGTAGPQLSRVLGEGGWRGVGVRLSGPPARGAAVTPGPGRPPQPDELSRFTRADL